jgi:hypothetical protein
MSDTGRRNQKLEAITLVGIILAIAIELVTTSITGVAKANLAETFFPR